jgi:hypothetical protein
VAAGTIPRNGIPIPAAVPNSTDRRETGRINRRRFYIAAFDSRAANTWQSDHSDLNPDDPPADFSDHRPRRQALRLFKRPDM